MKCPSDRRPAPPGVAVQTQALVPASRSRAGRLAAWVGTGALGLLALAGCDRREPGEMAIATARAAQVSFNDTIQPLLSENCYSCHGPDPGSRKAGLRLDRPEYAFAPLEKSGPAIVPGQPDESPLVRRIESTDEKEIMPPPEAHKTLSSEQIALLRRWIEEGAEYQEHWAFLTPRRPEVPDPVPHRGTAESAGRPPAETLDGTPIDRFIRARLAQEGLTPAPEADRRTLIRRVTYDLTGLPPSAEEVEAFVADPAPDAYARLVDRLLASPRYGEHRARYWLDYVRYADTHGLHFDNYRAIWPYRDYVIRAFNDNKPFDRFVREQLAGDLLPARTLDEWLATGYVRSSVTTNEGGTIAEEVHVNLVRDRVESFGAAFLGLTTGCAACHDHKFDPVSQRDFYQLAAFFSNTADKPWDFNRADPGPILRLPEPENRAAFDAALAERADLWIRQEARRRAAVDLFRNWRQAGGAPQAVSPERLELRLRFDEGAGDIVRNTAPGARAAEFEAEINPLVWGEVSWFWPSARLEMNTRLPLGDVADVDTHEGFSAGGWVMLRGRPGGSGIGTGSLFSRKGDLATLQGRGWEIYVDQYRFVLNLVHDGSKPDDPPKPVSPRPTLEPARHAIQVATKDTYPNGEWLHVFATYDGSGQAAGVKLYIDGQPVATDVRADTLQPGQTIRTSASAVLGRRDDDEKPLREVRLQEVRFYRRALEAEEVARLPFEDRVAEILAQQSDPARWTTDEAFVVLDRFFLGETDAEAKQIGGALAAIETRIDQLSPNRTPPELLKRGNAAAREEEQAGARLRQLIATTPVSLVTRERANPAYADILKRGDYYARGERVEPAAPHFLPPLPPDAPRNRLGLADWLLSPEQPLLTRVVVNRMWQEIFGVGLVETSEDFGVMGARPSHPPLLDWLAVEFRESGWDVKRFYRQLVMSATYRQSARVTPEALAQDPKNRLLARGPRFRMDAEMLRDSALAAAGLLVEKIGGPPVLPYQPPGLWEEVAMPESNTKQYQADEGESLYRRSIYTLWKRASPPPSMEAFDAPAREVACSRRPRTNTPLQAFVTMNDPQWVEAARKLAERTLRAVPQAEERLAFMASQTLQRPLSAREVDVFHRTRTTFARHFQAEPAAARALLAVGDSPVDAALDPTELGEWTMVASQFLNLDEFLTK